MTDRMTEQEIEALCEDLPVIANLVQAKCSHTAGDMIRLALTAIRQLQQPWRGIESAPRIEDERTNYLLLSHNHPDDYHSNITVGFWGQIPLDGGRLGWCDWSAGFDDIHDDWHEVHPTHWQPLPTPPKTER